MIFLTETSFRHLKLPQTPGIKNHIIRGNAKSWEDQGKEPTGSKQKAEP